MELVSLDGFYVRRTTRYEDTWCKECRKQYNRVNRIKRKEDVEEELFQFYTPEEKTAVSSTRWTLAEKVFVLQNQHLGAHRLSAVMRRTVRSIAKKMGKQDV